MGGKIMVRKMGIIWAVISLLIGCASVQEPSIPIYESNQYATEIARLEVAISQDPESVKGRQAHYQLAQLYTSDMNPRRNYKKSLENLKLYLLYHPAAKDGHDLQNWLSVLKGIEQLETKLKISTQENLVLKEANSELEKANVELATMIDILKTLDHRVEEKRKNYNSE
jgi:hypothetical protein